jgi:hypothetical protein
MAEVQPTVDPFSLSSQIERSEQRIARQRQIVEDLVKFNVAGPAQQLLALMEQTLAGLREQQREQHTAAPPPGSAPEPTPDQSLPQPETVTAE